ncbi:unnamed protein product [Auanema sp. JU1783]|nr:unnamed protein product [Auanema sp. JU1783]
MVRNHNERVEKSRIYRGLVGGKSSALLFSLENALTYLSEFTNEPLLLVKSERVNIMKPVQEYFGKQIFTTHSEELEKVSRRILVNPDFSTGMESQPVPVFDDSMSEVVSRPEPSTFNYITQNEVDQKIKNACPIRFTPDDYTISCTCETSCGPDCACITVAKNISPFECITLPEQGCIFPRSIHTSYLTTTIFCGDSCGCPPTCPNRLSNLINPHNFEVFKSDQGVGYCARTLSNIQYGEVVCEFVGEIKTENFNEDYAFSLCSADDEELRDMLCDLSESFISEDAWSALNIDGYFIDPYHQGNISRLFKHSCLPNLIPIRAIAGDWRPQMHHILMVALAPIAAGTELTFNYGLDYYTKIGKNCKCNSICCSKVRRVWKSMSQDLHVGAMHGYISGLYQKVEDMEIRRQKCLGVHDDDECSIIEHKPETVKRQSNLTTSMDVAEKRYRLNAKF